VNSGPLKARRRRTWSRPLSALWGGFRRNPRLAWQLATHMTFDTRSLRRFCLVIHGKDFLADVFGSADEAGIRVFLMWGTLLGAVRHQGLLPNDTDLDFGLLADDYRQKDAFVAAMVARGYLFDRDEAYKLRFFRRDRVLHADFDVFFPHQDRMICIAPANEGGYSGAGFPADSFSRLKPMIIADDLQVLVPDPPERVLVTIYGPGWRVPDPNYKSSSDLLNRVRIAPGEPVPSPH